MKKALLALSAFAGVLLALFLCGNVKAEAHEDHCICGGTTECIPMSKKYGHEGDANKGRTVVEWQVATNCSELIAYVNAARTAGETDVYIALADSDEAFSMDGGSIVYDNAHDLHVHICLNGRTLTKTNSRILTAYKEDSQSNIKLSICDCSAGKTGTINRTGTAQSSQGAIATLDRDARLYLYSVTLTGGTSNTYGGNVSVGSGEMYMYGAKVLNGTCNGTNGGNIYVGAGKLYCYGGTVSGGTAQQSGGNVHIGSGKAYFYDSTISDGRARASTSTGVGGNIRITGDSSSSTKAELVIDGGYLLGGLNNVATQDTNGHSLYIEYAKVTLSGDLVMASANSKSYPMTLQNGSAELYIKDNVVIYKTGGNANILQCTSNNSNTYISGGTFHGAISGHMGKIHVSGGYFANTIGHAKYNGNGLLEISGGYFAGKSTSSALSIPDSVWKIDDNAWIPFNHSVTYTKADKTTGSFTTAYSVTSCQQVTGRNMTLNENLALGLYVNVDLDEPLYKNGSNVGKISVTLNGETKEAALTDLTDFNATTKKFVYDGVTPELMGDDITVTLYASNGTTVLDTKTYTIKEYLLGLLTGTPTAKLTALVNDLLIYGGQAQLKFNHNTANLVSDGITGSNRTPVSAVTRTVWNKTKITAQNYQDAAVIPGYFKEAAAIHENINWIRVLYRDNANDDGTTFKIQKGTAEAVDATLDHGYLCTEGLMPTEYDTKITFYAYRGGELLSQVEYSINAYCVAKNGTAFSDALYNYGASAAAYAAAN